MTTSSGTPAPSATRRSILRLDPFLVLLLATVGLASVFPAVGIAATGLGLAAKCAVVLLFFLHGAKLPREAVKAGILHWRLHLLVLAFSFVVFPLFGLGLRPLAAMLGVTPSLQTGLLFLCCLPSTVQSSIAFTSMARGNVPAAVCSASASNLLGIVVTPALVALLVSANAGISTSSIEDIALQLLLPFVLGQLLQPYVGGWVSRNKALLSVVDRGSILLMVYSAFGDAVVGGIWSRISVGEIGKIFVLCIALLAIVLLATTLLGRQLGFSREDQIVITFCGSKKSLVSGVPMANVLFPAATAGVIVLPLMIFHQIQLMACGVLAQRFAREERGDEDAREMAVA